jgi:cell division protein ZipA
MAELRWVLLAAGILVLAVVFWLSRREARGETSGPAPAPSRRWPRLGVIESASAAAPPGDQAAELPAAERIVTVRLIAQAHGTFAGEDLVLALQEAGLRHGRFGIFHRVDPKDEHRSLFSVASLVEPGSFDLARVETERYAGVSLFMLLPGPAEPVVAFDDMLATARGLARRLEGEILDEQGSRLSVQRERYLREEVIQFRHKPASG